MKQKKNDGFRTHIAEPRWQQVVSVLVAVAVVTLWILAATVWND